MILILISTFCISLCSGWSKFPVRGSGTQSPSRLHQTTVLDAALAEEDTRPFFKSTVAAEQLFKLALQTSLAPVGSILGTINAQGREELSAASRPNSRDEAWRYTSLRTLLEPQYSLNTAHTCKLTQSDIAQHIEPSCEGACLVLVNGMFRADLSSTARLPAGLTATSLRDINAAHTLYPQLVKHLLESTPGTPPLPPKLPASLD